LHIEEIGQLDPLAVVYLDHDPKLCTNYTVDAHVRRGIQAAAQHLSNVWHEHGAELTYVDWANPARAKEPTPPGELDWLRAERFNQRILLARESNHPATEWAGSLGGNYHWLWRYAMGLLMVWQLKTRGAPHPLAPTLYTLEVMPPLLLETCDTQTEPPLPAEVGRVLDGDYVDGVASWRAHYRAMPAAVQKWSFRKRPDWL
jgi:hypothetical protein